MHIHFLNLTTFRGICIKGIRLKNRGENIILNLFFVYYPYTQTRVHVQFRKKNESYKVEKKCIQITDFCIFNDGIMHEIVLQEQSSFYVVT